MLAPSVPSSESRWPAGTHVPRGFMHLYFHCVGVRDCDLPMTYDGFDTWGLDVRGCIVYKASIFSENKCRHVGGGQDHDAWRKFLCENASHENQRSDRFKKWSQFTPHRDDLTPQQLVTAFCARNGICTGCHIRWAEKPSATCSQPLAVSPTT
jgi:hypothetical protein